MPALRDDRRQKVGSDANKAFNAIVAGLPKDVLRPRQLPGFSTITGPDLFLEVIPDMLELGTPSSYSTNLASRLGLDKAYHLGRWRLIIIPGVKPVSSDSHFPHR